MFRFINSKEKEISSFENLNCFKCLFEFDEIEKNLIENSRKEFFLEIECFNRSCNDCLFESPMSLIN